jgi:hypothetical protein
MEMAIFADYERGKIMHLNLPTRLKSTQPSANIGTHW